MVPEFEHSEGAAISRAALAFWKNDWKGKSFMAIGAQDPVLGPSVMHGLRKAIAGCPEPMVIEQAGHFVQEHGEPIARAAMAHFGYV
jgi:tRNA(adenine34) deaminase